MRLRTLATLSLIGAIAGTGCQALLGAEATPVPGAAATLTRSSRTPIPTPVREPSPSPAASPLARSSPSPSPAAARAPQPITDDELGAVEREMDRSIASADLPNIESLLLDRISLSTPAGGQIMDRREAATWLREHAGPGIRVTRVDPSTQTVLLEVVTEGWPNKDPIEQGRVTFNMRRYDDSGRPNDDGNWKIDVIGAE